MSYTLGPPVFRVPLEPITVHIGGMATFNCDVYSNPILQSVSWIFNGVRIVSDNLRITVSDTRLVIDSVQSEDEGSYSCDVTNAFGSQQSAAILTIGNYVYILLSLCGYVHIRNSVAYNYHI